VLTEVIAPSLDVFCFLDFKEILLAAFNERKARDPKYSLRAFARDLDIRSPRLSEILNGKYGLSGHEARRIGERLEFSQEQLDYFVDLVMARHGRSRAERQLAETRLETARQRPGFTKITAGAFDIISRWYNVPLLEMLQMNKGRVDIEKFAHSLGVSDKDVEAALDDLTNAGLLIEADGFLHKNSRYIDVRSSTPAEKIREFHKAVLMQAMRAIETQGMETRKSATTYLTMSSRQFKAARKSIELFEQRFISEYENEDHADAVVCLSMQLFEVAKAEK